MIIESHFNLGYMDNDVEITGYYSPELLALADAEDRHSPGAGFAIRTSAAYNAYEAGDPAVTRVFADVWHLRPLRGPAAAGGASASSRHPHGSVPCAARSAS